MMDEKLNVQRRRLGPVLRLLNAIRSSGLAEKTKFYQACTSEL